MEVKLKNKNILVTGGAGFIGSHLVDTLIDKGGNVVIIDDLSSGRKENINPKARFYNIDIRDLKVRQIIKKNNIEIVFHLAAQPIVEKAHEDPTLCLEVNIMGTVNILEGCRQKGNLQSIIIVSSDKAYGKSKKLPYKETDPLKGDHPYDVSKTASDLIAQMYFRTYNLPVIITRFSNVFGPRDVYFNRIIPGIMTAIIKNKKFPIRSNGKMVREYTYVKDIVDGCLKLVNNKKCFGEAFNFGSKNIFSVLDVVKKVEHILDRKIDYNILNITKNEIPEQYLDWEKAKKILNWKPQTNFAQAIKETHSWYEDFLP
jgi:CDP-glucose 4,6-dehydratase